MPFLLVITLLSRYKYSSFYSLFLYFTFSISLFFSFSLFPALHVVYVSMYVVNHGLPTRSV